MSEDRECRLGHNHGSAVCSDHHWNSWLVKGAISNVSQSIVSILTYGFPDDKLRYCRGGGVLNSLSPEHERVCWGSGVIIECEDNGDDLYFANILTAATIFKRTHDNKPREINMDVYLSGGVQFKGEVVCCDFHYNLAIIRIQGNSSFPIAKLRELDDCLSLDPIVFQQQQHSHFQIRAHSELMKILPGQLVIALGRLFLNGRYDLQITPAYYSEKKFGHDCQEVYGLKCCGQMCDDGGPVINHSGEVIGIRFHNKGHQFSPFLPTNVISRWWSYQKNFREFRRPWLGMKVCNLHAISCDVLSTMPNITTGVIVTEIQRGSPARLAKIRCYDVIVQCNGIDVRSILEFFERIWESSAELVEFKILRVWESRVVERKRTLSIGNTTPDNFYSWCLPPWRLKKPTWVLEEENVGMVIDDD